MSLLHAFICQQRSSTGMYVQINSETDFVAKNERFRDLVTNVAQAALHPDLPAANGNIPVLVQ